VDPLERRCTFDVGGGTDRPCPEYDPVLVRASTVPVDKLPPLSATASVLGTLLATVATDLDLRDGVRVVAGTPDLHSVCVGSGAVLAFRPHVAISTTNWISYPIPKKADVIRQMATVPGILPDLRLVANN
jgi:sugar (pentulose or hexulose) kinase